MSHVHTSASCQSDNGGRACHKTTYWDDVLRQFSCFYHLSKCILKINVFFFFGAETDVDEGHDWDIFNINEGLRALNFSILLCCVVSLFLKGFISICSCWAGPVGGRHWTGGSKLHEHQGLWWRYYLTLFVHRLFVSGVLDAWWDVHNLQPVQSTFLP